MSAYLLDIKISCFGLCNSVLNMKSKIWNLSESSFLVKCLSETLTLKDFFLSQIINFQI